MPSPAELNAALSFLGPFGWIADPEEPDPVVERFGVASLVDVSVVGEITPERIVQALKNFQAFNDLPVTGELDGPTVALMETPRCGVPDARPFVLGGSKWASKDLTYSVVNWMPHIGEAKTWEVFEATLKLWGDACGLSFRRGTSVVDSTLLLSFHSREHGDGNPFDGPGRILGHCFYPSIAAIGGDTHCDSEEDWRIDGGPTGIDLFAVLLHEVGHGLGIDHSQIKTAVMYAYYSGPIRSLTGDDVAAAQELYGPPEEVPAPTPPAPAPEPFPPALPPKGAPLAGWVP